MRMLNTWLKEIRPQHILKSIFLYFPIVFGGALFDSRRFLDVTLAALLFYAISTAVYIINDIIDRDEDRENPARRQRPIASGEIPVKAAVCTVAAVTTAVLGVAFFCFPPSFCCILVLYFGMNVFYSAMGKKIIPLDIFLMAIFFEFRTIAGAIACGLPASHWLLTLTALISLLLAIGKRSGKHGYPDSFVKHCILFLSASVFILYTVYVFDLRSINQNADFVWLTIFPVLYGIVTYLKLSHDEGKILDPVPLLCQNIHFQTSCVIYSVLVVGSLYIPNRILAKIFFFIQ